MIGHHQPNVGFEQIKLCYYINVCITLCFSSNHNELYDKHLGWYQIQNQHFNHDEWHTMCDCPEIVYILLGV